MLETDEAALAREMLAAGVCIAGFESRFERNGGLVGDDVHREWETAVARWWELAVRYETLRSQSTGSGCCMDHAASIARMFRLPPGCWL